MALQAEAVQGKTFFLRGLATQFAEDEICLLSQDNYYKPLPEQTRDDNGIENFDLRALSIVSHFTMTWAAFAPASM
ncbi:MAG: hypothetical protein WDO15_30675 [Bacteroidota bacterium]